MPERPLEHGHDLERAAGHGGRQAQVRHPEPRGDRGAVAVVAVEQLEHARGRAERGRVIERLGHVDGVDQPDAVARAERVGGPRQRLVGEPGEPVLELVIADHPRPGGY